MDTIQSPQETEERWPTTPSAILIMGKRQGTKRENRQLWGRAAMAAALWYSAPAPKPYILFVAADIHGPHNTPDGQVVKSLLVEKFGISADFVIIRPRSLCTLIETRAARAVCRAHNVTHIFALTHLYHAPRAQRYLDEVFPNAAVIPVHPEILAEISFPPAYADLLPEIQQMVQDSQPGRLDLWREYLVEGLLNLAHTVDPRGRFERRLARLLRPGAYHHSVRQVK
ncbi:MAG: hypothetical protein D6784_12155 [Chloroflexi bacterium]|nr:MAG: hypothetical protein D6784_12155 [Chloroflexota bacterium]